MPEPTPELYPQNTCLNRLITWFAATRPAFFSASVLVVICALVLAWHESGHLQAGIAVLTILAIMLFHAGANVLNDYYDSPNDKHNHDRIYPFSGGSRFLQNQVLSHSETFRLGALLLLGGIMLGLWLVYLSGLTVLWIGLAGGLLAVFYSAPPCLACRGLGDVTIVLSFGVLPVAGTVWLQLGEIPVAAWWLGVIVGIFTAAILWINSIPDMEADRRARKMTLVVRLGNKYAPYGLLFLFALGFALLLFAPLPSGMRWGMIAILPALLAFGYVRQQRLCAAIPAVLITHTVLCLGMSVGGLRY